MVRRRRRKVGGGGGGCADKRCELLCCEVGVMERSDGPTGNGRSTCNCCWVKKAVQFPVVIDAVNVVIYTGEWWVWIRWNCRSFWQIAEPT